MSYESPISLIYENAQRQMQIQLENGVYSAVQNVGIDVNKDELIKALQYDRQQYDKGYSDGMWYADHRNKWISVKDRLPEEKEWVLCYCRAKIKEVLRFQNGEWYHDPNHTYMYGFVTHWMPLPEPPKEGDRE